MLTVFSNLLPKVSETGKTVKHHSQIKILSIMAHPNSVNE